MGINIHKRAEKGDYQDYQVTIRYHMGSTLANMDINIPKRDEKGDYQDYQVTIGFRVHKDLGFSRI